LEQEEYDKEGINWTKIDFVDNQPCIDLISKVFFFSPFFSFFYKKNSILKIINNKIK